MSSPCDKKQTYLLGVFVIIFFILIYALNYFFPLCMDDWAYSLIHGTNSKVNSLSDILSSQYEHYYLWGGRSVVHFIAQYIIFIDHRYSIFLNTCIYILFIWMIYKFANKNNSANSLLFIFIFTIFFLLQRVLFNTAIWLTGSANYLWGTTFVLIFLYVYYYFYQNKKSGEESWLKSIPIFFSGVIVGWCNENTSVCLITILFGLCWLLKKENRKIPYWYFIGATGVIIGFIIMLKAPGNYIRYTEIMQNQKMGDNTIAHILNIRIPTLLKLYVKTLLIPVFCWGILYFLQLRNKTSDKKRIHFSILLIFASHIGFISMITSPYFPQRATFSLITFVVIAIAILYNDIHFETVRFKFINKTKIIITLSIFFVAYYTWRLSHVIYLHNEFEKRELSLNEQKKNNIKDIVFTTKISMPHEFRFYDISSDSTFWLNRCYSIYNGVSTVRLIPEEENKQ